MYACMYVCMYAFRGVWTTSKLRESSKPIPLPRCLKRHGTPFSASVKPWQLLRGFMQRQSAVKGSTDYAERPVKSNANTLKIIRST